MILHACMHNCFYMNIFLGVKFVFILFMLKQPKLPDCFVVLHFQINQRVWPNVNRKHRRLIFEVHNYVKSWNDAKWASNAIIQLLSTTAIHMDGSHIMTHKYHIVISNCPEGLCETSTWLLRPKYHPQHCTALTSLRITHTRKTHVKI